MAGVVPVPPPAARLQTRLRSTRPPELPRHWAPLLPSLPAAAGRSGARLQHGDRVPIPFALASAAPAACAGPPHGDPVAARFAPRPIVPRLRIDPVWTEATNAPGAARSLDRAAQKRGVARRRIPGGLKLIALVAPTILLLALDAAGPRVFSSPLVAKVAGKSNFGGALSRHWREVRGSIAQRAGFEYADDFHSGLDAWTVASGGAANWSYDSVGFVKPGNLALLRSSMQLADYDVQFAARVERKGLGFVFRAKDMHNYEVVRFVMTRPAPLPQLRVIHYAVREGREGPQSGKPLPVDIPADTFFDVRLILRGGEFTLMVQDKIADFWTDARSGSGGIGFFCGRGELARIRDVEITHQNDTLGRLCAFIAPHRAGRQP